MKFQTNFKPSRTKRKIAQRVAKLKLQTKEKDEKAKVRMRDKWHCRFPLCGCRGPAVRTWMRLEVAHLVHKGMGGNPKGDRSTADQMIYLCEHRHQHGGVSLHKGTLRIVPLTREGTNGPVRFLVTAGTRWTEVAREKSVGVLDTDRGVQLATLLKLAEMDD